MRVGSVREIWRYPVKSMAGERLARCRVEKKYGIPGDRGWAIRDEQSGEIQGAKKIPGLLQLEASYLEEPAGDATPAISIRTADDRTLCSSDLGVSEALSAALGRPVTLFPRMPATDTDHYRRSQPLDMQRQIRESAGLLASEPFPDLSVYKQEDLSLVAEFVTPPGTYFDFFELHLLTTASLESLAARSPESHIDRVRFRPNLLIETEPHASSFPELEWCGKAVRIGDVRLGIAAPMMRCGMVTAAQRELPKQPSIMRSLVRECNMNLGVGALVQATGRIREGDGVELID